MGVLIFPVSPNFPHELNMGAIRPRILAVKMDQRQGDGGSDDPKIYC